MVGQYSSFTLPNGIRVVHIPSDGYVGHCGFFVNAGTRDEASDEYGMAHFVEHMLFKGTQKRRSFQILNRMESVGGELNAFTNKEETVIYSTFLIDHYERAMELLSDLVFNSKFPQPEIDKEVDVIIDEIASYQDSPSEQIYDDFEDMLFANKSMGHNILGTEESLQTFTTQKTEKFVSRCYSPSKMVFFSFGAISLDKVKKYATKYLSDFFRADHSLTRESLGEVNISNVRLKKETSQAHVILGGKSYPLANPKRKTLSLINNFLGGSGMNTRLNIALREKKGLVYTVESNVNSYSDIGLFYVYFGCNKSNVDKCIHSVKKELNILRTKKLSTIQLHNIKRQYLGQLGISIENTENLALALGKNYFYFNHFNSLEEIKNKIESITSEMILEVSNEIFSEENLASLIFE